MADATTTHSGTDQDRASLTRALNAARDLVIQAGGVPADTTIDLVGRIVLANFMPNRRLRTNPRTVKQTISKYNVKGRTTSRVTYPATITVLGAPTSTTGPEPQLTDIAHWVGLSS